jgi:hypothetical protein
MEISRLLGLEGRWKLAGGVSHRKAIKKDCAPAGARENDRHAIDTALTPLPRRVQHQGPENTLSVPISWSTDGRHSEFSERHLSAGGRHSEFSEWHFSREINQIRRPENASCVKMTHFWRIEIPLSKFAVWSRFMIHPNFKEV